MRTLLNKKVLCAMAMGALALWQAGAASAQIVARPIKGDPVVIDSGKLDGKLLPSGVKAYFGIPYAAAPVRQLRWRAPQPATPWEGVYHADRMGPECIQLLRRKDINHYFGEEATSEDCLYMNIWAPGSASAKAKLPVIVFIHGGGFTLGSSGMALYGGENVAASGKAIFVNLNYRLGILGFMAHPELSAESPRHASGNYGFLDQVAALAWIKRNIARFGGDPSNVTISGQSAGAASVVSLIASPLAKGLFQRAVVMSGPSVSRGFPTLAESEQTGLEVQAALGVKSLDEMRQLPGDKVFSVQRDFQFGASGSVSVRPNIDGHFLPAQVGQIFADGKQNDVPTIVGFTNDDISVSPLQASTTLDQFRSKAKEIYGSNADEFLRLYPADNDADAASMGRLSARHAMMEKAAREYGLAQRASGKAPFYMYVFSRVHPFNAAARPVDNPKGAYHTSDVPYWFQTQDALNLFRPTRNWGAVDRALARRMRDNLLAFARSGDPATAATPWPQWRPDSEQYLDYGDAVTTRTEEAERMRFHNLPAQYVPLGATPTRLTRD